MFSALLRSMSAGVRLLLLVRNFFSRENKGDAGRTTQPAPPGVTARPRRRMVALLRPRDQRIKRKGKGRQRLSLDSSKRFAVKERDRHQLSLGTPPGAHFKYTPRVADGGATLSS